MTDRVSRKQRSDNMRAVRGRDTMPEVRVRRVAHRLGYRFRTRRADLPGKPDTVFPRFGKVCIRTWVLLASAPTLPQGKRATIGH